MKIESNPFAQPNILDRNIEKFNDCNICGHTFCDDKGEILVPFRTTKIDEKVVTVITCSLCGTEYKFKNWK